MPATCHCGSKLQGQSFELLPEGFVERVVARVLATAASRSREAIQDEVEDLLVEESLNVWLCSDCGRLSVFGQGDDSPFAASYAADGGTPSWTIGV